MTGLLTPFGLDIKSRAIIEPEDAKRGRACDCICPGCKAPLLSRHPKNHRNHFAHDSKHPDAKPEEECPFSSAVAIAMMARELAESLLGKTLSIPEYDIVHQFECCSETIDILVTEERHLTITNSFKEPRCGDLVFDLELEFGEARIYIDLFYEGKPRKYIFNENILFKQKAGVLAINCDTFDIDYLKNANQLRFSDAVRTFVLESGFRKWSFHPRQIKIIHKIESSHNCQTPYAFEIESNDISNDATFKASHYGSPNDDDQGYLSFNPKKYTCAICKNTWLQNKPGIPNCSQCNTHLFSVEVKM